MRIAFIFPVSDPHSRNRPLRYPASMNMGISYISSVLKANNQETRLFVLSPSNRDHIKKLMGEFDPQLICFTAVSTTYYLISDFSRVYKEKHPQVFLVAGGCHVSLNPDEVINDSFDAICIGEGEYSTLELVKQLEQGLLPSKIANLWIKKGFNIEKNLPRPFIDGLDRIPFPDRNMWNDWIRYPNGLATILLSRGCPFKCTYCCNHKLARLAGGNYCRFRDPQHILDEIREYVLEHPQTKTLYLESETIAVSIDKALQLCSLLEQFNKEFRQPLEFGVNLRIVPNMNFGLLFQALSRANFKFVNIGLESGSERVTKEILKRKYSNNDIIQAVKSLRKYGLKLNLFIMLGLPGETLLDFQQTIEITRKCQPDSYYLSIFYPYPGTELATKCIEQNLIENNIDIQNIRERYQPVLNLPDFPKKQILHSYIWFDYYVSKNYQPIYKILIRVLMHKVTTSPRLGAIFNFLLNIPLLVNLKNKLVN